MAVQRTGLRARSLNSSTRQQKWSVARRRAWQVFVPFIALERHAQRMPPEWLDPAKAMWVDVAERARGAGGGTTAAFFWRSRHATAGQLWKRLVT